MKQIMVLGTFHMNSQLDVHSFHQQELLAERESEIAELVDRLSQFRPTKIAVEIDRKYQPELDAAYRRYPEPDSDAWGEVSQIGFCLAKRLGLERLEAVDWMEQGAATKGCSEVLDYCRAHQSELAEELEQYADKETVDLTRTKIRDVYLRLNSPEAVENSKAYYVNYARIGNESYYGMGWLIWWYQRNLHIFSNVAESAGEEERILLIIGAAHKGILEEFLRDSKLFHITEVLEYI